MKRVYFKFRFKAAITIEAAIMVTFGIYVLLFLVNVAMYMYDCNALVSNMIRGGNIIQNYIECGTDMNAKTITSMKENVDENKIKDKYRRIMYNGYMFSRYKESDVKLGFSDINLKSEIEHIGLVIPFKNIKIVKEIKMANLTPSKDLRRNKEIKNIIE